MDSKSNQLYQRSISIRFILVEFTFAMCLMYTTHSSESKSEICIDKVHMQCPLCVCVRDGTFVCHIAVDKLCSSVSNKSSFNSPFVQFINYIRRLVGFVQYTHTQKTPTDVDPTLFLLSYFATPQNSTILRTWRIRNFRIEFNSIRFFHCSL